MAEDDEDRAQRGLSRRTLIKGAVATGAAVWAAPVIDSFVSAAAAGSSAPCPPFACDGSVVSPLCGNAGPGGNCFCAPTVTGAHVCVTSTGLRIVTPDCQSSADCPAGYSCIQTLVGHCFGHTSVCAPACPGS